MLDQPKQLGVRDVEPEAPVHVTDGRQGIVERALNTGFVVPKPPHAVGGGAQDEEPEEALNGEDPEKQLAAQLLTPADHGGLRCWTAAVLPVSRVRAAAQAAPGLPRRGRNHQPLPQLRLARRVCHVTLAGTPEQAPVHLPRVSSLPRSDWPWSARHEPERPRSTRSPRELAAVYFCGLQ